MKGTSLAAIFGNETSPAFTASDASLGSGDFAGIRAAASAFHTVWFDNFDAGVAFDPFGNAAADHGSANNRKGALRSVETKGSMTGVADAP
ncbi:MAG: hypothetical protein HY282_01645 [Nitrospirae bacterium]|nr:hypothetical protein [Candidatus Manganitrophaceae bacterium]